jgi:hypothetical protein
VPFRKRAARGKELARSGFPRRGAGLYWHRMIRF